MRTQTAIAMTPTLFAGTGRVRTVAIIARDLGRRGTLARSLVPCGAMSCVGSFGTAIQAVRDRAAVGADVFLVDAGTDVPVAESLRCLRAARPNAVALAVLDVSANAQVFEALCNGATGCLSRNVSPERLATAIEDAANGGAPLSPEFSRMVVSLFQSGGASQTVSSALTPRERTMLALLACGCTYVAAARRMGISVNTVRNHVRRIYEKLQVRSKGHAVATGFRHGLIDAGMLR